MKTVNLTDQQWDLVGQAIDAAVKAQGVAAAIALVPVFQAIQEQLAKQAQTQPPPP